MVPVRKQRHHLALSSPVRIKPAPAWSPRIPYEYTDRCVERSDYPTWELRSLFYNHSGTDQSMSLTVINMMNGAEQSCLLATTETLSRAGMRRNGEEINDLSTYACSLSTTNVSGYAAYDFPPQMPHTSYSHSCTMNSINSTGLILQHYEVITEPDIGQPGLATFTVYNPGLVIPIGSKMSPLKTVASGTNVKGAKIPFHGNQLTATTCLINILVDSVFTSSGTVTTETLTMRMLIPGTSSCPPPP